MSVHSMSIVSELKQRDVTNWTVECQNLANLTVVFQIGRAHV